MALNFSTETKEQQQPEKEKRLRKTRKQAENEGAITKMPKQLAIPTLAPYQNALSTVKDPYALAYLQPIKPGIVNELSFVADNYGEIKLHFGNKKASRANLEEYYDSRQRLDLPTLRALYSVILQKIEDETENPDVDELKKLAEDPKCLNQRFKLYLPSVLQMLGYKQNSNDGGATIKKIERFSSILGVMKEEKNGKTVENYYPVMVSENYDDDNNTIEFASPYITKLVMTILCARIQKDKQGNPRLKRNGKPFMFPSHSYLINASIAKEKNQRAVEIVCIVVTLIEQAGGEGTPHIRAQTIINRCPDLKNALENGNKSLILKRAFARAWELLPKQTNLDKSYENIKFPTTIPTASTLDMVFEFAHEGKVK